MKGQIWLSAVIWISPMLLVVNYDELSFKSTYDSHASKLADLGSTK